MGRLDVTVQEEILVAGRSSNVSLTIRNPLGVPVEIIEVQGPSRPVATPAEATAESSSPLTQALSAAAGVMRPIAEASLGFGGISVRFPKEQERTIAINAEKNSEISLDYDLGSHDTLAIRAEEGAKINISKPAPSLKSSMPEQVIEAGCDRVFNIEVGVSGWLFFTPRRFQLSTQITYRIDGREMTQVETASFDVKPPLASIIVGGLTGGILGSAARLLQEPANISFASCVQSIAAVLMSAIAAITLSRKSGAQAFITVEDFFGAFAVGALIGYGGAEYFRKAIIPPGGTAS